MNRINKISEKKRGLSPGSLIFTGEQRVSETSITLINFDVNKIEEKIVKDLNDLKDLTNNNFVSWINVNGLHEVEKIEKIGEIFGIHPLAIEDILNVASSPKMDDYDSYTFLITKMIEFDKSANELNIEQVSFILSKNYLITFHEKESDIFELLKERIRNSKGRIRKLGGDYLMYRLLDSIVDNYFVVLEHFDDKIEQIEDNLLSDGTAEEATLESIHSLRKNIVKIRRSVFPLRDITYSLEREQSTLIQKSTYPFLRDLFDHIRQNIETLENYREAINGMLEIYLSNSSHKMNEVIKLLTMISTIFIPLTFIVGIYGMNFSYMPELGWRFGYPAVIIVMLIIVISLIFFFKRKKWF